MNAVEASDQIVVRFCSLHGGLEAGMPFVVHQFKKIGADFSNPSKEELKMIVLALIRLLRDYKSPDVVDREKRLMLRWVNSIEPT